MSRRALVSMLAKQGDWMDAKTLAGLLHVSTRTIRNWVKAENAGRDHMMIESGRLGYRLAARGDRIPQGEDDAAPERVDRLLLALLRATDGVSSYDLADSLHVSDSSLASLLRDVRDRIRAYGLEMNRYRDAIVLEGEEQDKRRLINALIASSHPQRFTALVNAGDDENDIDRAVLAESVATMLEECGLDCTEFGLNSIVVHVITMIDRIKSGCALEEGDGSGDGDVPAVRQAAEEIYRACADRFCLPRFESEIAYLRLSIQLNTKEKDWAQPGAASSLSCISEDEWRASRLAVAQLEEAYHLDAFDEDFLVRLAAHVHYPNLRSQAGSFTSNPLAKRTKASYPLFYDMAVFLAGRLMAELDITLNEDEIGFLAFRIGGYFESSMSNEGRIPCTVVYTDYLDFREALHDGWRGALAKRAYVIEEVPFAAFRSERRLKGELVISPFEIDVPSGCTSVIVSPLLGDRDFAAIEGAVDSLRERKRGGRAVRLLSTLLRPELFWRNAAASDRHELITKMAARAMGEGLCDERFLASVLRREEISSTAFDGLVAVPHPLEPAALRSFLAIAVNDRPIAWGDQSVCLVMLIGLSSHDQKQIWSLFEDVLGVLSDQKKVIQLLKAEGYDDFLRRMDTLMSA